VFSAVVRIYAGYYDTHHSGDPGPKPNPWQGSPNVVFLGNATSRGWDSSTVRLDNVSGFWLASVKVTVDISSHHFALWKATSLAAGQTLILAQTATANFDGSDTNPAGCYGCNPKLCATKIMSTIPVVHVTVDGVTASYRDSHQIRNTHGADRAGCPYTGLRDEESEAWHQLAVPSPQPRLAALGK
jgi:hypothetical protein